MEARACEAAAETSQVKQGAVGLGAATAGSSGGAAVEEERRWRQTEQRKGAVIGAVGEKHRAGR